MRIWLYSHLEESPGNELFIQAASRQGHSVERLKPGRCHLPLSGVAVEPPDLLFTRVGSSAPASALAELAVWERLGIPCVNSSLSLGLGRDKSLTLATLGSARVPVPRTVLLGREPLEQALLQFKKPPWILKHPVSTKGQGVMLIESRRSLRSVVDSFQALGQPMLLQEFVASAKGADIRVIVLGGKARAAVRREAPTEQEFRSNLALGGRSSTIPMDSQLAGLAEAAAQALGLEVAGVDILEGATGPLVVEVNGAPGLTAAPDFPNLVISYLETREG